MATINDFDDLGFISLSTIFSAYQPQQQPKGREDSSDTDSSSGGDTGASSGDDFATPHGLSKVTRKEKQLIKFLDHIAETFAREKSVPSSQAKRHERRRGTSRGQGAHHVTASGMVVAKLVPTVYIAKNGGVDSIDRDFARSLTIWLRAIAASAKRPSIDKDVMWVKLVGYCKQRLDIYAAQIGSLSQSDLTAAFAEASDGVGLARELHTLSVEYATDGSLNMLQRMISIAYKMRYEPTADASSVGSRKARTSACFLGRLRAAYEAFKETAIEFQKSFMNLTIVCLEALNTQQLNRYKLERRIEELAKHNDVPRPKKEHLLKTFGKGTDVLIPCHAEVQLLLHFESVIPADADCFPYIGCSKKSCWLCHQLLSLYQNIRSTSKGFYQTRGCHGRVYPLWRVPLNAYSSSDPRVPFYFNVALMDIQDLILRRLRDETRVTRRAPVAESSTNVTAAGGLLRRRALAKQRVVESSPRPDCSEASMDILKDFLCSRECLRIPANSELPHLLSIKFYRCPDKYRGHEPQNFAIPDFGAYWGMFNFDRAYRCITMTNQDSAELNGEYLLYWCCDNNLPPNQNLMSLLGIKSLGIEEQFWHGDVFITRFHEDEKSFTFHCEDVPLAYLGQKETITNVIRSFWESKELEREIKSWQHLGADSEKRSADKEIILARMSRTERKILKKTPGMLDYLALCSCDDGALIDGSLRKDDDDPEKVRISSRYRRTAIQDMGWKGFSSEDL